MKMYVNSICLFLFASLVLSACGAGLPFGPTLTPAPTPTPLPTSTPTQLPGPKVGYWEGNPSFSFEIGTDGQLHNFEMEIDSGGNGSCIFTADVIPIESDGTFQFTFGENEREDVNTIKGRFESNVTFSGTRSGSVRCTNSSGQILGILSLQDVSISAEWKEP